MSGVKVLKISIPDREARLTLKQATEVAGLCVEDFMKELSRRKISIINLDRRN